MINTAADYQLITPVGRINGSILPARDVRGNGADHVLCAEDLCFAIEALRERVGLLPDWDGGLSNIPSPSLVFHHSDWNQAWYVLRRYMFHHGRIVPVVYDAALAETGYTTTDNSTFASIYPDVVVSTCYTADVTKLVLDPTAMWRGFYYDLLRSDRILFNILADTSFWCSGTATYTYRGDSQTTTLCNAAGHFAMDSSTSASTVGKSIQSLWWNWDSSTSTYTREVDKFTSASLAVRLPLPSLISSAVVVQPYQLYVKTSRDAECYRYFTRTYNCTVTNTGIEYPSDTHLIDYDLVSEVQSELGLTIPASISPSDYFWKATVTTSSKAHVVVKYDFRTEIRSLNWQWTP